MCIPGTGREERKERRWKEAGGGNTMEPQGLVWSPHCSHLIDRTPLKHAISTPRKHKTRKPYCVRFSFTLPNLFDTEPYNLTTVIQKGKPYTCLVEKLDPYF